MYSPIVLSSLLILLLSHLSAALPQPKDLHLFTRDPPYDGARAGCHPSDYITSCAFFGQGASTASAETDAIAQATSACKATCWPALNGVSAADWDPKGCAACLTGDAWTNGLHGTYLNLATPQCSQFFEKCVDG